MIIFSLVLLALMWWSWLIILFDGLLFLILILAVILIRLVALLVIFLTIVSDTGCLLAILLRQSTTNVIIIDNHLFACVLVDSRSMVSNLLLPFSSFRYVTALYLRNIVSEANFHMTLHRLSVWLLGVNIIG